MNISEFGENFLIGAKMLLKKGKIVLEHDEPKLLMILGSILLVGGTISACRATLKITDILDGHEEMIKTIEDGLENPNLDYSEDDAYKDRATQTIKTACKIAKNYIPAVVLEIGAIICVAKSYSIMNARIAEGLLAYEALDAAFRSYRENVKTDEQDMQYLTGLSKKDLVKVDKDDDTMITLPTERNYKGPFEFIFSAETSEYFDRKDALAETPHYNLHWLKSVEKYCNDLLSVRGHLFLNEVLDELGIQRTPAGALVGWLSKDKTETGCGFIDFNIYENYRYYVKNKKNENSPREYILTMNVDPGVIWDKIV